MSITLSGCAGRKRPKSPLPVDALDLAKAKKTMSAINRPDPATLATVVDGLALHISTTNKTGYKGVCYNPGKCPNKPYRVAGPQPEQRSLGYYETVLEAAVAYAQYLATTPEEFEKSKKSAAVKAQADAEEKLVSRGVLKEFEGVPLHLSAKNSTGYKGVSYKPAAHPSKPYQAVGPQPDGRHLGYFTNSLDAAVAYAKFVESPSLFAANEKQNAAIATAAAERSLLERGVLLEAQGYKLHLSANRKTGYLGVRYDKHHPNKPYKAEGPASGHKRSLGYHATAVDAAVAYAKYIAHPELYHSTDQEESSGHWSDEGTPSEEFSVNSNKIISSNHSADTGIPSDNLDPMETQELLDSLGGPLPLSQRVGTRPPPLHSPSSRNILSGFPSPRSEHPSDDEVKDGARTPSAIATLPSSSAVAIAYPVPFDIPMPEGHPPSQHATARAQAPSLPMPPPSLPMPPPSVFAPLTPPQHVNRPLSNSGTTARPLGCAMRGELSPPSQSMRPASDDDSPRTLPAPECEASRAAGDATAHASHAAHATKPGDAHSGDSGMGEVSDLLAGIESAFPAAFEQWCREAYMEGAVDGDDQRNHESTHDLDPSAAWKWAFGSLGTGGSDQSSDNERMAEEPQNPNEAVRSFWL